MVLDRASGEIQHRVFRDLPGFLTRRDCLVLNRTRVLPARFHARRVTGGRISGLFIAERSPGCWQVLLTGAGRVVPGERLQLERGTWAMTLIRRRQRGLCEVQVEPPDTATTVLATVGQPPLPPYIRRGQDEADDLAGLDRAYYQTVYAAEPGAIAAPTAGMHFTRSLLDTIRAGGTSITELTLHIGLGTFQPVEVENLADHHMHREWYELRPESVATIEQARASGGRIVAVGTTTVRVLETCSRGSPRTQELLQNRKEPQAWARAVHRTPGIETEPKGLSQNCGTGAGPVFHHRPEACATGAFGIGSKIGSPSAPQSGRLRAQSGWTNLLIYPPYVFRCTDVLLTNFHLPGSTLLALVYAFAGREAIMNAYRCAVSEGYRFYSYGDAMLIL